MWACGTSRSRRSGRGRLGCTSRVRGGAVWDHFGSHRKVQLQGRGRWPAAQRLCRARGNRPLAIQVLLSVALVLASSAFSCCTAYDYVHRSVLCAVKRSADVALASDAPDTLTNHDNENVHFQLAGGGCVPPSAAAAHACAYGGYTPPYSACNVQTARRLLPGQPLPQGMAAFGMAMPAQQPQ